METAIKWHSYLLGFVAGFELGGTECLFETKQGDTVVFGAPSDAADYAKVRLPAGTPFWVRSYRLDSVAQRSLPAFFEFKQQHVAIGETSPEGVTG